MPIKDKDRKKTGYYSAEAIIARNVVDAGTKKGGASKKSKPTTGGGGGKVLASPVAAPVTVSGTQGSMLAAASVTPPQAVTVTGAQGSQLAAATAQGLAPRPNQPWKLPQPEIPKNVLPDVADWDYKTAKTDMQGNTIKETKLFGLDLTPQGFDPFGKAYFGGGINGWLKGFAYKLVGDEVTEKETEDKWKNFWDTSQQFSEMVVGDLTGAAQGLSKEDAKERTKKETGLFVQGVSELFGGLRGSAEGVIEKDKKIPGLGISSPLTPLLRLSNASLSAAMDAFQFVSELPEKMLGVNKAMREYADAQGSTMPDLAFDDDQVSSAFIGKADNPNRLELRSDYVNTVSRLFGPLLVGYDNIRFWSAPGTLDEKLEAVKSGWVEGRLLFSELVHPTIEAEFQRRAQAGEDPYLLAMELEDPWAELVGEVVLDPFNLFGISGKAKKIGSTIQEAAVVVEKSGPLADPKFISLITDTEKLSTPAQGSAKLDELTEYVMDYSKNISVTQDYSHTALTAAGNQRRYHKLMGNYSANVIQTVRNTGGSPDDVLDYFVGLLKRGSDDRAVAKEGIAALNKSPLGKLAYNQASFEVQHILKQTLGEGDSLIRKIQDAGTDWQKMRGVYDDAIQNSLKFVFPSVTELSQAADKAKAITDAGGVPDKKMLALTQQFAELERSNPGVAQWSKVENFLSSVVMPINGLLANSYFSLNYGYAFRNLIQNFFTLGVDDGFSLNNAFNFQDGFKAIDNAIIKRVGDIPPALKGKTFIDTMTKNSFLEKFFSKLNKMKFSPAALADAAEVYSGKMIYLKYFDKTMGDAMQFGAGLPDLAKWETAGFTKVQAEDFLNILKSEGYNEADAFATFNKKYGGDSYEKWKALDFVNPDVKKGLEGYENFWGDIVQATKLDDQKEVLSVVDGLKKRIKKQAGNAKLDIPAMSVDDPAWKSTADAQAIATKKFYTDAMVNEEIILRRAMKNAVNEMDDALTKAAQNLSQDAMLEQNPQKLDLSNRIIGWLGSTDNKRQASRLDELVAQKQAWANDIKKKAKSRNFTALWDEAVLGTRPDVVTYDNLFAEVWNGENGYYQFKKRKWDGYYKTYLDSAAGLAKEVGVEELFATADKAILELDQYRNMTFTNEGMFMKPPQLVPANVGTKENLDNIIQLAKGYGVPTASAKGNPTDQALNIINKFLRENADDAVQYTKLDDIPADLAEKAFADYTGNDVKKFIKQNADGSSIPNEIDPTDSRKLVQVAPPHDPNLPPSGGRVAKENEQGVLDALNHVRDGIVKNWGLRVPNSGADMTGLTSGLSEKLAFARARSMQVAEKYRDFALLPYGETKNMDFAMSLVYPYQFWYKGTYANWLKRSISTNPEIISRYANLKDTMAKEHADLPEWWKYQVPFQLPGMEDPVMFNLEATVWPLYGLTGTDFNDPEKRTNWFTAMVDDAGKFGPSIWAPIQWGIAGYYALNGENDIAAKWGTRAIPQTATIKAISSYFGTPIELDPNVRLFSGDGFFTGSPSDPQEEGRISRALAAMAAEGYSEQELLEAARTHSGPLWDEAYQRAIQARAPGQILSALLGVGFKARTPEDIETDQFYADYARMRNLHDGGYLSDEQYAQGFNEMREKYPFMDIILLSRRAGLGREEAYAYNVISRIPPGMTKEIYEAVGIDPKTAEEFYNSGGKLDGMNELEKQDFITSMVNAGAMLAIPSDATRQEWNAAKAMYKDMQDALERKYGDDITIQMNAFFGFDNKKDKDNYMLTHPDLGNALDDQQSYIAHNNQLIKYYGGIDTIERHYTSLMYEELDKNYPNIDDVVTEYYALTEQFLDDSKGLYRAQKAFKQQNPELQKYWDAQKAGYEAVLEEVVKFGDNLPEGELTLTGNQPANPKQEALEELAQPVVQKTFEEFTDDIGAPLAEVIQDYWYNDEEMSWPAIQLLKRRAEELGYEDEKDLLEDILLSMPQQEQAVP